MQYNDNEHRSTVRSGDTTLSVLDYGGAGAPVLLLHGLAGHAGEWENTAEWLVRAGFRVYALDQRGHGKSDSRCADFSRRAYVDDVAVVVRSLRIAPAVVVGQSMGALNAYLVAARYAELVRGIVLVEAGLKNDPAAPEKIAAWLDSWPLPFADREAARKFFGSDTLSARTWAAGMVRGSDGYRPMFHRDDIVASVRDYESTPTYEGDWKRVSCPALLMLGDSGWIDGEDVSRMARIKAGLSVITVPDAGHDVHLDNPNGWRAAALPFLESLHETERKSFR